MKLPFLNRHEERARLEKLFARREGSLGVLFGRRRCGKSRLLYETLSRERSVLYVGDDQDPALQRAQLAKEIARLIPGFDEVAYPDWTAVFARWWREAKRNSVLVLDEFPSMVSVSSELPSLLQRYVDHQSDRGVDLILAGSSQRMMQGLVLDASAPLFGRANEILKISPMSAFWIRKALRLEHDPVTAVEAYSVWGGVPRYWELATDHPDRQTALSALVYSPLGVLHEEPKRLLMDDLRETTQVASILSLIGQGCHRVSEIAARLQKPSTSLSRPLQRLIELELVRREVPLGSSLRSGKRSLYRISDPFLRYWYRFVEPNLSQLEMRPPNIVLKNTEPHFSHHVAGVWEELVRESLLRAPHRGIEWARVGRWWGAGLDRQPQELDVLAESGSGETLLVGEVKWEETTDVERSLARLEKKASLLPLAKGKKILLELWVKSAPDGAKSRQVTTPRRVLEALK